MEPKPSAHSPTSGRSRRPPANNGLIKAECPETGTLRSGRRRRRRTRTTRTPAGDLPHPAAGAEPLHLATVIDLCSTRLVGYEIADRMRT